MFGRYCAGRPARIGTLSRGRRGHGGGEFPCEVGRGGRIKEVALVGCELSGGGAGSGRWGGGGDGSREFVVVQGSTASTESEFYTCNMYDPTCQRQSDSARARKRGLISIVILICVESDSVTIFFGSCISCIPSPSIL
jgi:hypothetical protein